jgi:hypothetical protein
MVIMVCTHVKELYSYVKKNKLKVSAMDILTVECQKCKEKDSCDVIG